jgi:hypothetical protein
MKDVGRTLHVASCAAPENGMEFAESGGPTHAQHAEHLPLHCTRNQSGSRPARVSPIDAAASSRHSEAACDAACRPFTIEMQPLKRIHARTARTAAPMLRSSWVAGFDGTDHLDGLRPAQALSACHAILVVDPHARFVHREPATPASMWARGETPGQDDRFAARDLLTGRFEPQLGGHPRYLDALGDLARVPNSACEQALRNVARIDPLLEHPLPR